MTRKFIFLFIFIAGIISFLFIVKNKSNSGQVAGVSTNEDIQIKGLILPHHSTADNLINNAYLRLSKNNRYINIVIIGTNHFYPDQAPVITNIDKVAKDLNFIVNDSNIINGEHSISLHLPYLNKYFPNAKIIPLIVSPSLSELQTDLMAEYLKDNYGSDSLFLLSVDFSHNLGVLEGLKNNEETINALKSFNFSRLYSFNDSHIDSNMAAIALLKVMQKLKTTNFDVWQNSHSAIILNDPNLSGTGYVIGSFY